jgi:hypothetical protein
LCEILEVIIHGVGVWEGGTREKSVLELASRRSKGEGLNVRHATMVLALVISCFMCCSTRAGADTPPLGTAIKFGDYKLQYSGYVDESFHQTQFFVRNFDNNFFLFDTRLELLPQNGLIWGPYGRFAGNISDHDDSSNPNSGFENVLNAEPGGGMELFPFSVPAFNTGSLAGVGTILGPLRLFGEYNHVDYTIFGAQNDFRPNRQVRAGFDYFAAYNVNDVHHWWWLEPYASVIYQSTNEFTAGYNGTIFGTALRAGIRIPNKHFYSWFTPYLAEESSVTSHPGFAFENYCHLGAGVRIAPPLDDLPNELKWMNRFIIYGEYLDRVNNYRGEAPGTPNYDWRIGIDIAFGQFFFNE